MAHFKPARERRAPEIEPDETTTEWYEGRNELEPGQVFRTYDGSVVMLDRSVPGDATRWYVADWWNGWSYMDSTAEPGDLRERLPDDYAGDEASTAIEPERHVIQLSDYAEWDSWAEANADAIIAEYGSVEHALQHAIDGGLTLGGGAAPEFLVCFEDRP